MELVFIEVVMEYSTAALFSMCLFFFISLMWVTRSAYFPSHQASGETFKLQVNKEQNGRFLKVHNICKMIARHHKVMDANAYYLRFKYLFIL